MRSPYEALYWAAKHVVSHWNEFGPEYGLDEWIDGLERVLRAYEAAKDTLIINDIHYIAALLQDRLTDIYRIGTDATLSLHVEIKDQSIREGGITIDVTRSLPPEHAHDR